MTDGSKALCFARGNGPMHRCCVCAVAFGVKRVVVIPTTALNPFPHDPNHHRKTLAASKPSQKHPHPLQASSVIINTSKHVGARGSTSHPRVPRQTPRVARQAWVHKSRGPQICSGAHVLRPRYVVVWVVRACVCDLLCGKKEEAGLVCVGVKMIHDTLTRGCGVETEVRRCRIWDEKGWEGQIWHAYAASLQPVCALAL